MFKKAPVEKKMKNMNKILFKKFDISIRVSLY